MNIVSGFVVFVMIWWVVMFCVLPVGMPREMEDKEPHVGPGAHPSPQIKKKMIMTTLISLVLWCIAYALISADIISFRDMAK